MKSSSRDTHNVRRTSWRRLLPYAIPFLLGAVLSAGVGLCLWRFHYGLTDAAALSSTSESAALRGANAELETLLEAAGPEHFSRYLSPAMKELHEMVMGPDEAIDLARANLLVASEIPEFRGLDIGKALSEIDDIAPSGSLTATRPTRSTSWARCSGTTLRSDTRKENWTTGTRGCCS
jgi:hypothetical protein